VVVAALLSSTGSASAEPAGPFLAASVGGGELGDAPPGLTGGGLGLRGHLEVGYGDGRFIGGALSLALARADYTNRVPPPETIQPDADLRLTRVGFGAVVEGRLPLGRLTPSVGLGVYLDRLSAKAGGARLGIRGDYFATSDVAVGAELRAGLDLRVHPVVQIGARAGWSWSRADLGELTAGADWLAGPWLELRVTFDASGFRMGSSNASAPPGASAKLGL